MQQPPRLVSENREFRCGYGPRSLRLSLCGREIFVGCKDGSITRVDLAAVRAGRADAATLVRLPVHRADRSVGVRALCDLGDGWLMLGHDAGPPTLLRWRHEDPAQVSAERSLRAGSSPQQDLGVTCIDAWDPETLLVSFRHHPALLLPRAELQEQLSRPGHRDAVECPGAVPLHVYAVSGMTPPGRGGKRTLVSKDGRIWIVSGASRVETRPTLWTDQGFDRPGFVFDVAGNGPTGATLHLTTDQGIFRLRAPGDASPERRQHPRLDRVFLSGIAGMPQAIALSAGLGEESYRFLWVSDLDGGLHLFWRGDSPSDARESRWRRTGIREGGYPVVRAVATHWPDGPLVAIGQACRNDTIVVTWYEHYDDAQPPRQRQQQRAEVLSWGKLADLVPVEGPERKWHIAALLADWIERSGEDPSQLRRFLRNPDTDLAFAVLARVHQADGEAAACRALTLLTLTLLGTVHRRLRKPEQLDYLGIIRWLRRIAVRCSQPETAMPALAAAIESQILYARKWGLFGRTYADRPSARSALLPRRASQTFDRRFDQLIYHGLIFERMIDLEAELSPAGRGGALLPWDLKALTLDGGGRQILAVSWNGERGIEVYQRLHADPAKLAAESWQALEWRGGLGPAAVGHSRSIVLGSLPGEGERRRPYLVEAPAAPGGAVEKIVLHWLDAPGGAPHAVELPVADLFRLSAERPERGEESVYSLCELAPGCFLVGLKGIRGAAQIGIVTVDGDGALAAAGVATFPGVHPQSITPTRNPVWSIATPAPRSPVPAAAGAPARRELDAVIGCGDGQIFWLRIAPGPRCQVLAHRLVSRLGSPVRALACAAAGPAAGAQRVFAGGADGTIAAFELLPDGGRGAAAVPTHGLLWATREDGPIDRILLVDNAASIEGGHLALAVTQRGLAVMISNRPTAGQVAADAEHPHQGRMHLPGGRLGRIALGGAVFGAAALPISGPEAGEGQVARIAVATAQGTVRVVGLHFAKYTAMRHKQYGELWQAGLGFLRDESGGGEIRGELLRRFESVFVAAPAMARALVRWILEAAPDGQPWTVRQAHLPAPAAQWIPRHLRALVDLDLAWCAGEPLRGRLKRALADARAVADPKLFKEILEVALRRANRQLAAQAATAAGDDFAIPYRELLDDLGEVKAAWLGEPANLDIKMRITIVKNLFHDGETLRLVARARMAAPGRFASAVAALTGWVQRLLGDGDPLLEVETLRSVNIALMRACTQLDRRDLATGWERDQPDRQLDWSTLSGIFEAIGDFAGRATHSRGAMGEVVAHEICRAYALGMLACPPVTVRLASWMGEADLPAELVSGVADQLAILVGVLHLPMPPGPLALLQVLAKAPGARDLLTKDEDGRDLEITADAVGRDNADILAVVRTYEGIVAWLRRLARQLAEEAGKVDLLEPCRGFLQELEAQGEADSPAAAAGRDAAPCNQMRHSRSFWRDELQHLLEILGRFPGIEPLPGGGAADDAVRPDLVRCSDDLALWSTEAIEHLNEKRDRYEMFEPHSSLYRRVLYDVRAAAQRFRGGAALQKNIVLGVLGHNLLERLDEHLLDLWEMAQALDPQRVWDREDETPPRQAGDKAPPRAAWFADQLLMLSRDAATIPKNLRILQSLMAFSREASGPAAAPRTLADLVEDARSKRWSVDGDGSLPLDEKEYPNLRMVVAELAQNDQYHGVAPAAGPRQPDVWMGTDAGRPTVRFRSPLGTDANELRRVTDFISQSENLQRPVEPRLDGGVPSHGTGLYLANLAAAVVGWKLSVRLDGDTLVFELVRTRGAAPAAAEEGVRP